MRVLIAMTLMLSAALAAATNNLMPAPAKLSSGQGEFRIDGSVGIVFKGYREPRLELAARRLLERLSRATGDPLERDGGNGPLLEIDCQGPSQPVQRLGEDESYRLSVEPGRATITAATPLGAMHGMETFLQLVELRPDGFVAPAVTIEDSPRFPWRGLMLDVARHWMPPEVVYRTLDAMAAVKLNVFHWHLSDDQGFRIESQRYPLLQEKGSDGHFYTQDQVRQIIAYAHDRGIRVVPEFDMPGHTASWFPGYPELASMPGPYQIIRTWGINDPTIDPTREETYQFLDGFIGEMAALFPDAYFHIGGDEVNGHQWNRNARIQDFKRAHGMKSNEDLQAYFNRRVLALVQKHGKKMIGWDEVLHPDLSKDIVVQSWRGQKSLAQAAMEGFSGILSSGYYLDLMQPASQHYEVDPLTGPTANLTPEQQKRILGGEACMWVEYAVPQNVDERIWPRMAAIAERLWSPRDVRDVPDMYRRLTMTSRELDWLGLTHQSNYERRLERLAGNGPLAPVAVLAAVVEPVKGYARGRARKYTQQTPLNRLVDTVHPESAVARQFGALVDQYLASRKGAEPLREWLALWRANDAKFQPVAENSGLLAEIQPISRTLAELAAAGLEALDDLEAGRTATQAWTEEKKLLLQRASPPQAELLISVLGPVRKLIEAAER